MPIKELPIPERPYEKMKMYGSESLSNSELLAIIIKTGTKEKTAIELAQEILKLKCTTRNEKFNLRALQDLSIEEFMKVKGIGVVKAIQLRAICELTKRISRPISKINIKIQTSKDVADLLIDELKYEKREKVKELMLNTKNDVLKIIDLSYGGTDFAVLDPKDALFEPIRAGAPKIILVHNHPSGDPEPSTQDINITKRIYEAAKLLGIQLLDHIVIGDGCYKSIFSYIKNIE